VFLSCEIDFSQTKVGAFASPPPTAHARMKSPNRIEGIDGLRTFACARRARW